MPEWDATFLQECYVLPLVESDEPSMPEWRSSCWSEIEGELDRIVFTISLKDVLVCMGEAP